MPNFLQVRLAKELKDNLKKEQEGSNSALKLDIHHMTVRYHDIIRAQEKLMADLERSIERRDRIIQQADIALHHKNKNVRNTKLNIQRNFTSLREKNKLLARVRCSSRKVCKLCKFWEIISIKLGTWLKKFVIWIEKFDVRNLFLLRQFNSRSRL